MKKLHKHNLIITWCSVLALSLVSVLGYGLSMVALKGSLIVIVSGIISTVGYFSPLPDDKKAFIDRWKDLDEQSTDANESIQQLFYYNMFYYRALDKDTKTTTPGVRKYYAANKFERLYKPELLDTLFVILNLWKVVNKGEELEDEAWSKNIKIRQTLDILTSYPNEYWKYPVVIYYVCYRNEENFETRFARFLNKLLMELMTK